MTLLSSAVLPAFDEAAHAEIRSLLQSNQARTILDRLQRYEARDRVQQIHLERLRALAKAFVGDYDDALHDWVHALRLTSRFRELRPKVRAGLADTLACIGDLARAERVAQRCVAEVRAEGDHHSSEPWALNLLGRLHTRRGTLSLAVRLFERGLTALGSGGAATEVWVPLCANWALALIRLGEFRRADEVLSQVEVFVHKLDPRDLAPLFLTRAKLELYAGDLDACERMLERTDERVVGDHLRFSLVRLQYLADVHITRGESRTALVILEDALQTSRTHDPEMDDMVTELSRLKATALLNLGRPQEALEVAHEAIRASRGSDMLDQPAGLRVAAGCLAALGRFKEAKVSLASALSLLESTEFLVERGKLYRDMESLGMPIPGAGPKASFVGTRPNGTNGPVHRFELADGRRFVTSDLELADRIQKVAESRLPVLLEGETGTGKELVARLLHEMGNSREGPFVVVDCTTLSETLAEAELFGVARGAYTGAASDRHGLVGAADGGTLLFDELPELSLSAQSKLLRLLQEGTYRRLGEARARMVRVRVIATANQDTEALLAAGKLKADLFFRLHGYRIRLHPLRDRPQDITPLAEEFARAEGLGGVTPEALAELRSCPWPGNARQLEMLIRVAASSLGAGAWLEKPLVTRLLDEAPSTPAPSAERQRLRAALDAHSGNVAATARALNLSRQGLYKALHRHGLI